MTEPHQLDRIEKLLTEIRGYVADPVTFMGNPVYRIIAGRDDVVVVRPNTPVTDQQATLIRGALQRAFPDNRVLVLGHDLDVTIMEGKKP